MERHQAGRLPQWLADRFGWESMVGVLAQVYNRLPEEQRSNTYIFTETYGEAAAVGFFGPDTIFPVPSAAITAFAFGDRMAAPDKPQGTTE